MISYGYSCGHRLNLSDDSILLAPPHCEYCDIGTIIYPSAREPALFAVFDCTHQFNVGEKNVDCPKCLQPGCSGVLSGFRRYAEEESTSHEGRKYDEEKPAMDLMPPLMELEVSKVLTFGAQKYSAENWRQVPDLHTRYRSAAKRHINALRRGEMYDEESGCHHAAHAVCCLMFLGEIDLEIRASEA